MLFKYKAYNLNGKKISDKIEANSISEAKEKLSDLKIIEIKPTFSINISFSKKIPPNEMSVLFSTLGLYLKSNINIITAIKLTISAQSNLKLVKFLNYLQKEINEGKSFASVLQTQTIIIIPSFALNAIQIGEKSGNLDLILLEIAKYLKTKNQLQNKLTQALVYPLFIVTMAIFMISFMLVVIVPKIEKIFQNLHQKLPTITQDVISIGNFFQNNYLSLFIMFGVIVLLFKYLYKNNYYFKYFIDLILLKIPVVNKMILSKELGEFTYFTYVLTNSGVNFLEAINLSTNTLNNNVLKKVFLDALNEVLEGKKFSVALSKNGFYYDKTFIQSISLVEETSEVKDIMKNISEIYLEQNENKINIFLSLLEPALIIFIGIAIGVIVVALLLPIFSISVM